jgi:hypothetical protein
MRPTEGRNSNILKELKMLERLNTQVTAHELEISKLKRMAFDDAQKAEAYVAEIKRRQEDVRALHEEISKLKGASYGAE